MRHDTARLVPVLCPAFSSEGTCFRLSAFQSFSAVFELDADGELVPLAPKFDT